MEKQEGGGGGGGGGGNGETGGGEGELEMGGGGGGELVGRCSYWLLFVSINICGVIWGGKVGGLMLFNDTCLISVRIFGVMYYHTFSKLADHRWIEEQGYTK